MVNVVWSLGNVVWSLGERKVGRKTLTRTHLDDIFGTEPLEEAVIVVALRCLATAQDALVRREPI